MEASLQSPLRRSDRIAGARLLAILLLGMSFAGFAQPIPEFATGGQRINVARGAVPVSGLVASGASGASVFGIASGALPPGISLQTDGRITGTSTVSGEYRFRVRATDSAGDSDEAELVIVVNPQALQGAVQGRMFTSPSTGLSVPFTLYLPAGYANGTVRYPVVYHLHGLNGAHNGGQANTVPRSFEAARAHGLIRDAIIVFPDGFGDSFWADSVDGSKPAETHLAQDLVEHIDSTYRTLESGRFRVASGYSMGGFGAAKLATKFPDLFATGVIYDGAMLTWTRMQNAHPLQATEIFGDSEEIFDAYSPWFWLDQNADALFGPVRLRDAVGALRNYNAAWRDAVLAANVAIDFVETGLPHQVRPLLDAQGANMWIFIESRWASAAPIFADDFESVALSAPPR